MKRKTIKRIIEHLTEDQRKPLLECKKKWNRYLRKKRPIIKKSLRLFLRVVKKFAVSSGRYLENLKIDLEGYLFSISIASHYPVFSAKFFENIMGKEIKVIFDAYIFEFRIESNRESERKAVIKIYKNNKIKKQKELEQELKIQLRRFWENIQYYKEC